MNRLRELAPEQSLEQLCALFGKTRQAYYQKLNYNYQEYAEDGIILDLIAEYRKDMGRLGGRKLWTLINTRMPDSFHIGRDRSNVPRDSAVLYGAGMDEEDLLI